MNIEELVLKELINRELAEKSNIIVEKIDRELDNIHCSIKDDHYRNIEELNKDLMRYLELIELRIRCLDINELRQLDVKELEELGLIVKKNINVNEVRLSI